MIKLILFPILWMLLGYFLGAAITLWRILNKKEKVIDFLANQKQISLTSACPACGHRNCELKFTPQEAKVYRLCLVCGCTVSQPVIEPGLFQNLKQVKT